MKLYLDFIRRQMGLAGVLGISYCTLLLILIWQYNADSLIYYQISPYAYASDPIDFFFGLLVSIPFAFGLFYLKKDNFLNPVALRISPQKYIRVYVISTLSLCFCVVFFTNIAGVAFSILIASKELLGRTQNTLSGYILGDMQMHHPLAFGVLWSLQKAGIGVLICLFAQIIAFYIKNLFFGAVASRYLCDFRKFLYRCSWPFQIQSLHCLYFKPFKTGGNEDGKYRYCCGGFYSGDYIY